MDFYSEIYLVALCPVRENFRHSNLVRQHNHSSQCYVLSNKIASLLEGGSMPFTKTQCHILLRSLTDIFIRCPCITSNQHIFIENGESIGGAILDYTIFRISNNLAQN
jgi:hypothetical protein